MASPDSTPPPPLSPRRFLNLVKANYWHQLESGFLSRTALTELIEAASSAQDDDSKCLDEWSRVAHHCKLPSWVQALNRVPLFGLLARRLINDHLAFALDVLTGFIQAHTKVEDHFRVLVQHKGAVAAILGESQRQLRRARGMLQSLSTAFPEISRSIVTKQAVRALLKNTDDLSHELLTHGEIEKKEYDRIQHGVYRAYKRLVTRPPVAAIPDPQQQLRDVRCAPCVLLQHGQGRCTLALPSRAADSPYCPTLFPSRSNSCGH